VAANTVPKSHQRKLYHQYSLPIGLAVFSGAIRFVTAKIVAALPRSRARTLLQPSTSQAMSVISKSDRANEP
jgi:hypothetical protein